MTTEPSRSEGTCAKCGHLESEHIEHKGCPLPCHHKENGEYLCECKKFEPQKETCAKCGEEQMYCTCQEPKFEPQKEFNPTEMKKWLETKRMKPQSDWLPKDYNPKNEVPETKLEVEPQTCAKCGHQGSMHSDGEYTHTGRCYIEGLIPSCRCEKFEPQNEINEIMKKAIDLEPPQNHNPQDTAVQVGKRERAPLTEDKEPESFIATASSGSDTLKDKMIEIPDEEGIWNGDMAAKEKDIAEYVKKLKDESRLHLSEWIAFHRIIDKIMGVWE